MESFPSNQGEIILGWRFDPREDTPPEAKEDLNEFVAQTFPATEESYFTLLLEGVWKTQWWLEATLNCAPQPELMRQRRDDEDESLGFVVLKITGR